MLKTAWKFVIDQVKDLLFTWHPITIGVGIVLLSLLIFQVGIG